MFCDHVVTNPCLGSGCSHICLLSDSSSEGYTCICPTSFILDSNQRDCRGNTIIAITSLLRKTKTIIIFFLSYHFMYTAPLSILYTVYRPYVRRVNLDGSNIRTLYSGGYPYAVDFDYRQVTTLRPFLYSESTLL